MDKEELLHPIGVVTQRTGLKPDLVRAWERRYGAIEPRRSEGGRRLYSDAEVERLALLRDATRGGHGISQVANLPDEDLRRLIADDLDQRPPAPTVAKPASLAAGRLVEASLRAVEELDDAALSATLERASLEVGRLAVIDRVVVPLMRSVGEAWRQGRLSPANEHLASAVLRSWLGQLRTALRVPADAPRLVVATPAGQRHELGASVVAALAGLEGWRVSYLGADLPAAEIAAAARGLGARAVALSLTTDDGGPDLEEELSRLGRELPAGVALLTGGVAAAAYRSASAAAGAVEIDDLAALRRTLRSL